MSLSAKETIADIVCRVVARQRGWSEAIRGRRLSLRLKSMRKDIAEHRAIDRPAPPVQSRVIVCSHAWSTRKRGLRRPTADGSGQTTFSYDPPRAVAACTAPGHHRAPYTARRLTRNVRAMAVLLRPCSR